MPRKQGWLRQFHQPELPESLPLLVFPHAGAGASTYREFSKVLSTKFSVVIFQYPGRQDRAAEAPLGSLPEIAAGAFDEFSTSAHNRGAPIVTYGHSMGAGAAFEFVRIAEATGIDVRQLIVSAAVAPCRAAGKAVRPRTDEEIFDHVAMLEGTNSDVLRNSDLMKLAFPYIKADYQACGAYSCAEEVKVAAPIHAVGGNQDPYITLGDLYGWFKHSTTVQLTMFDGGHFFLNDRIDAVAALPASCVQREQTL
jgi:surfactin synthase thioesterase subunit